MLSNDKYIAIPPGETIKEQLEYKNMTQKEFSQRLGMSEKHISKLINGEVYLTPEMAVKLEMVLGIPARFWNAYEAAYRETIIKIQMENEVDEEKKLLKYFPYRQLVKLHWIEKKKDDIERIVELRKYFEVVDLSFIKHYRINKVLIPEYVDDKAIDYKLLSWAQKAKRQLNYEEVKKLNNPLLESKLEDIKNETSFEKIISLLDECGVTLLCLPGIRGLSQESITIFDHHKVIILVSSNEIESKDFKFNLLHNIGHVVLGHIFLKDGIAGREEIQADKFASDVLLPKQDLEKFIEEYPLNQESIYTYSETYHLNPHLLINRLIEESLVSYDEENEIKKYQ